MSQGVTDQVQLKGSTNQVNEKLQAADLFITPSTNEPCSVALMEALALGQPALAVAPQTLLKESWSLVALAAGR